MTRSRPKVRPVKSIVRIGAFIIALIGVSGGVLYAQPAPTVVTKLRTTDTSTTSIRVGCTLAGTCTGGITSGPIDVSSVTSAGFIEIASNVPASQTNRLVNNAGTLSFNGVVLATGASLSGTTNTIPVFTASNAVGNSIMTQSGTTITVANTLNATTLGGTLSTATQNSVTTMTGLTSVGTIGTGVWNGTIIGLAKGGTGVSLSGTGGTSQFLRQNTVGGTISVVRPAIADLSDGSNVAVLNATNTFAPGAAAVIANFNSTAANGGYIDIQRSGVGKLELGVALPVLGAGTNDDGVVFTNSVLWLSGDGGINFADVGVKRWGINAAGDWTFGTSSHIADSNGTPTIGSGCGGGTVAGNDYAFAVQTGVTASTACTVNFGHTFSQTVCTASASPATPIPVGVSTSVGSVLLTYASSSAISLYVICRGF